MPQDAARQITPSEGWVEVTTEAVASIDLFTVNGNAALLCRWQDAAPAGADIDARHGIVWPPGAPEKDFTMPGGGATRMWVRAIWGETSIYIRHA